MRDRAFYPSIGSGTPWGVTRTRSAMRAAPALIALCFALLVSASALAGTVRYEVAPGDTLLGIANDYDVSVSDIRRWNSLSGDFLSVGQVLVIYTRSAGERTRINYTVRSGDTGLAIARRHGVSSSELERWNRGVDMNRLSIGQELAIYVAATSGSGDSGSRGRPDRGRLSAAVQLEPGTGYRVRDLDRAWGTSHTVAAIRNGVARVSARFVEVPEIDVFDLSYEGGGQMRGHRSHQNGLDADISYYRVGEDDGHSEWRDTTADELDVRLQWYLFRTWIDLGAVEYIFVDYELQQPLYEYARARGATEDQLAEWFQYPRRGSRVGIIRDEPGHDDHFHIRFHSVDE